MTDETHITEAKLAVLEAEADEQNKQVINKIISLQRPYWNVF